MYITIDNMPMEYILSMILHYAVVRSQRVVCVDAITNTGICAGGNLGTFVGPTAVSQCCTTLNAIAAYDVDSELCIPCNGKMYS